MSRVACLVPLVLATSNLFGCLPILPIIDNSTDNATDTPGPTPPVSSSPTPGPTPPVACCADYSQWRHVDNQKTCQGCTALIEAGSYGGRCSTYCESFGHVCVAANEERSETCDVREQWRCDQPMPNSDILCTCVFQGRQSQCADVTAPWEGRQVPPTVAPTRAPSPPTPPPPPTPPSTCVDLLVIGDQNSGGDQEAVAQGLAAVAANINPQAIAGVGDNLYTHGSGVTKQDLVERWSDIYMQYDSLKVSWFMITGNHDWYSDATMQREFTNDPLNIGGHWKMPDFWYKQSFEAAGVTVDAFFIDTYIWLERNRDGFRERAVGNDAKTRQQTWFERELGSSTADWKLVFAHHPIYTMGNKVGEGTLQRELDPLLRAHGVQMIFTGHSHNKQLIQYRDLNYVTSGAGGGISSGIQDSYPGDSLRQRSDNPGFHGLSICSRSEATLTFYKTDGQVDDSSGLVIGSSVVLPASRPQQ